QEIMLSVTNVSKNINQVSIASESLHKNSLAVGENIRQISKITETNAASIEEVSHSAEEQASISVGLKNLGIELDQISQKMRIEMQRFVF
ncbi:MAG: hypothetical protein AAF518_16595, partial [Spirochaetota bacterium]